MRHGLFYGGDKIGEVHYEQDEVGPPPRGDLHCSRYQWESGLSEYIHGRVVYLRGKHLEYYA
jgi:hypothetical protein